MSEFTIDDLALLLSECDGEDEIPDLKGQMADVSFEELGYDSLVLFNVISKVKRRRRIKLADNVAANAVTPRDLLKVINEAR
ncbi:MAG: hypothetical protein JO345_09115 [Streptosporangiaceae bacterium]|nr:hypothetical protein [Streptosporangiaceae bacterium]